jgi:5-methyltetrahydropteroyltriglutamate--homocysteine methyltransferase
MDLWKEWKFPGDLALGVIDQRSDIIETPQVVRERVTPALEYFSPDHLLLTSECGFGHVPLDISRKKLSVLADACRELRK